MPPNPDSTLLATRTLRQRFLASGVGTAAQVLLFVFVPFVAANIVTKLFLTGPGLKDVSNLLKTVVLVSAYAAYVKWREKRPVFELSLPRAGAETLAGFGIGGGLFALIVGVLAVIGAYSVDSVGSIGDLGATVATMMPKLIAGAVIEELIFRLILLRLIERSLGPVWALLISSLVFGLGHLGNVGATPLNSLALGFELGLLLGAAYLLTRRLWLCTGMHLAWNFVQGGVFSIAVSGHEASGWLRGTLNGPDWLTGGVFGAEGSVVAFVVCLIAAGGLLGLASRRGARLQTDIQSVEFLGPDDQRSPSPRAHR